MRGICISLLMCVALAVNFASAKTSSDNSISTAVNELKLFPPDLAPRLMVLSGVAIAAGVGSKGLVLVAPRLFAQTIVGQFAYGGWSLAGGGVIGMIGGFALYSFLPTDAESAKITDFYMRPENFERFLALSAEELEAYAQMDPKFAKFILKIADAAKQIRD